VRSSPFFDATNNKVIGKMKDEANGEPIAEFVGLKPKMYSYITDEGNESRRAKGVQRAVVKNKLRHAAYVKELNDPAENLLVNRRIQSFGHQLMTIAQNKRGLSAYDDKRFLLDDGIHTVAYGHRGFLDRVKDEVVLEEDEEEDLEEDTVGEDEPEEEELKQPPETLEQRRARVYAQMIAWGADVELAQMAADVENETP
jgi:hypothetical protein